MTAIGDVIPAELQRAVAERLAQLAELNRLMQEAARPSERGGQDDDDQEAT
jgi:hypothetical protein